MPQQNARYAYSITTGGKKNKTRRKKFTPNKSKNTFGKRLQSKLHLNKSSLNTIPGIEEVNLNLIELLFILYQDATDNIYNLQVLSENHLSEPT